MVFFQEMSEEYFREYSAVRNEEYAESIARSNHLPKEAALERAQRQWAELLPQGVRTGGQSLFEVWDERSQTRVGTIWYGENKGMDPGTLFIFDLYIDPSHRQKGFGGQVLLEVERRADALGMTRLALHVFGDNETALRLYKRLGYRVTDLLMAKPI